MIRIAFAIRNKKVLLRERKRHTARRIASARFADLSPDGGGVPPSSLGWVGTGVLHLVLDGGTLSTPDMGYPLVQTLDRVALSRPGMGYPPPHPHLGWGNPPYKCERTDACENITSRHPSDAGGKNRSVNEVKVTSPT